ncbi:uncharacterized protein [Nicotiana tomentosiformis]|uniref:uncharacterized protein n=1 Tax=Nicotiana tomentosiformis TaxID=4098 RepID=UPI00388CD69A
MSASLPPVGETVEGGMHNDGLALLRQEEASSSRVAMDVPSTANDREKVITEEDIGSDSDMDMDELRMIDEGLTQLKVRLEGGSRTIAIPMDRNFLIDTEEMTVILEIESASREKRRKDIYVKLKDKYTRWLKKYREIRCRLREVDDVQVLREDLKKRDEELMQVVEKCSILEGTLRRKEIELELRKGIEAQCSDIQAQVVLLRGQLEECQFKADALSGEVAEKKKELDKAESAQSEVQRRVEFLEVANRTLHTERENDLPMMRLKEEQLDERIGELEKGPPIFMIKLPL